jgi:formylglycine-generating enzyme required for sulfatase activity
MLALVAAVLLSQSAGMVKVGPGAYRPVYTADPKVKEISVEGFMLDRTPVTNAQYLKFVKQHPLWRKDQVKPLFAESRYLENWAGPQSLGPLAPANAPVVRVSWFAARAYCRAQGKRLPTSDEWELAGRTDPTDPDFAERILSWFSLPTPAVLPSVGQGRPSPDGVQNLHGLVWEWTEDFNGTLLASDSREGSDADRLRFCGAGATASGDRTDYAAFMRMAFRSSLQARYTIGNLGFRCAADLGDTK